MKGEGLLSEYPNLTFAGDIFRLEFTILTDALSV